MPSHEQGPLQLNTAPMRRTSETRYTTVEESIKERRRRTLPTIYDDALAFKAEEQRLNRSGHVRSKMPFVSSVDTIPAIRPLVPRGEPITSLKSEPEVIFAGEKAGRGVVRAGISEDEIKAQAINQLYNTLQNARNDLKQLDGVYNESQKAAYERNIIEPLRERYYGAMTGNIPEDIRVEIETRDERARDTRIREIEATMRDNVIDDLRRQEGSRRTKWSDEYVTDSTGASIRVSKERYKELRRGNLIDDMGRIISPEETPSEESSFSPTSEDTSKKQKKGFWAGLFSGETEEQGQEIPSDENEEYTSSKGSDKKPLSSSEESWLERLKSLYDNPDDLRDAIQRDGDDPSRYGY